MKRDSAAADPLVRIRRIGAGLMAVGLLLYGVLANGELVHSASLRFLFAGVATILVLFGYEVVLVCGRVREIREQTEAVERKWVHSIGTARTAQPLNWLNDQDSAPDRVLASGRIVAARSESHAVLVTAY